MIYICKPKKVQIYINKSKKTAEQVKAETGCTAIINGGLYDLANFIPVCHLKAEGKIICKDQYSYWGFGWNEKDLVLTSDIDKYRNYISCVCLVKNYESVALIYPQELGGKRARTAIGVLENGFLWVYFGADKISPEQLRDIALEDGVKDAIMLDGGTSTQGICPDGNISSTRRVHNYICIWDEKDATKGSDKMKVYLSPSSQPANTYAAGNTNEQEQCRRIALAAQKAFERCGFECKVGDAEIDYTGRVSESNKWSADIHIPIHTNAGGGKGPVVFVYAKTEDRMKLAQPVYDELNAIVPFKSGYGVRVNSFHEIKKSNGKCVYVEATFHDNEAEALWTINHVDDIGEAICKGICEGTGTKYIEPMKVESEADIAKAWAIENKIFIGDNGSFKWDEPLTREQAAIILHRMAEQGKA